MSTFILHKLKGKNYSENDIIIIDDVLKENNEITKRIFECLEKSTNSLDV